MCPCLRTLLSFCFVVHRTNVPTFLGKDAKESSSSKQDQQGTTKRASFGWHGKTKKSVCPTKKSQEHIIAKEESPSKSKTASRDG